MKRFLIFALLASSTSVFAHDVDPFGFEKQQSVSSFSRSEVIAQSKMPQAVAYRIDDAGRSITPPSTKTRAQVAAETDAAAHLGLLHYGELGPVQATAEQEQQITFAGQRAIGQTAVMK